MEELRAPSPVTCGQEGSSPMAKIIAALVAVAKMTIY
jgi:hypothetical protein